MAKFTPLKTGDDKIDRIQDAVARAFASPSAKWPTYTTSGRPQANEGNSHQPCYVKDPGQAERLCIVMQNADGSWAWVDLALAPH